MPNYKKTQFNMLACTMFSAYLLPHSFHAVAQSQVQPKIERYQVTGSKIKRVEIEGPSPITVITADDIKAQGFNTIYEALQSFAGATGDNRGQAMEGSARNAETVNLRGLGPNRTLFLLNGNRVANYPRVLNGNYNVFNIASIPVAAVDRIEIVTGASSSTYGSDAMAGVINIITKRDVENTTVDAHLAQSSHGDARHKRLSLVSGGSQHTDNWSFALEYDKQDMLTGKQRDWLDDRYDTPADLASQNEFRTSLPRALSVFQQLAGAADFTALDPGPETCAKFNDLTYTSISSLGHYCGRDGTGDAALIHGKENISLYFSGAHELTSTDRLSMDVLFWQSDAVRLDAKSWSSDFLKDEVKASNHWLGDGMFATADGSAYMLMRDFQPEEMLAGKGQEEHFEENMLNLSLALSGTLFQNSDYELHLSHSLAKNTQTSYQLKKEQASDYFVHYNPDTAGLGFDIKHWWQPLSEAGFNRIFGLDKSKSDASVTTAGFTFNTTVLAIERPIDFATFTEFESSQYDLNEHPRTLGQEGQGWIGKTGTAGSGRRNRYALGTELSIPLADKLRLTAAARYDRYLDQTRVDGAATYKLGLEWRPMAQTLIRASHGSIFRAPDLHNVFKGVSGAYDFVGDYVLINSCQAFAQGRFDDILLGANNLDALAKTCDPQFDFTGFYSTFNESSAGTSLQEETGYASTAGIVWSPEDNTSLAFDLFRIKLNDVVTPDSLLNLNLTEWQCLSGQLALSSPSCNYALSRIERNAELGYDSFKINKVRTSFINMAMQETTGFDVALNAAFALRDIGLLTIQSAYSHILQDKMQSFAGEAVNKDYRDDYYNSNFRSKINSVFSLTAGQWQVSLTHIRYGSLPNQVNQGDWTQLEERRYAPLNLYNFGLGYQLQHHQLRLGVINLFDSKARSDASEQEYPYFKAWAYPQTTIIIGRQLTLSYRAEL